MRISTSCVKAHPDFLDSAALKSTGDHFQGGQGRTEETIQDGLKTNITMQEIISDFILFFALFRSVLVYVMTNIWTMLHEKDPHECSVLISVHVIYSSIVLFTPEHGLHTVRCRRLMRPAELLLIF